MIQVKRLTWGDARIGGFLNGHELEGLAYLLGSSYLLISFLNFVYSVLEEVSVVLGPNFASFARYGKLAF